MGGNGAKPGPVVRSARRAWGPAMAGGVAQLINFRVAVIEIDSITIAVCA
jgi:hypothetical protein